jgi:uncharacterized protein YkwD
MDYCYTPSKTLSGLIILALIIPFIPISITRAAGTDEPGYPLSSITAAATQAQPQVDGCGGTAPQQTHPEFEQEVLRLVNLEREARGIPPLKRSTSLDGAARYHSADLGIDDYFSHDTYDRQDGNLVFVCSPWTRIANFYDGARGENIAAGYTTPESVVAAWMASDGHRHNILSTGSREIGIGYFEGAGGYYTYWTQDFGAQYGVYPLVINKDDLVTNDPQVNLYVYGEWDEIRLRNDSEAWSGWQPFQNSIIWQLPPSNGEHIVSVEIRTPDRNVASQDTISIAGLSQEPRLNDLTDSITFTYFAETGTIFPALTTLTPENIGSTDPLVWEIDLEGSWLTATPEDGVTPQSFNLSANVGQPPVENLEPGLLTLTVTSPANTEGSPHAIHVTLNVVSGTLRTVFIPMIIHPNP